jgi:hypothetical protein
VHGSRPDTRLPIFVYGALKVNEIAWLQISDFVLDHKESVLTDYELKVSDGIAFASPRRGRSVLGNILYFRPGQDQQVVYSKISAFEGTGQAYSNYQWVQVDVQGETVNLLELRGRLNMAAEASSWSLIDDEAFAKGIPWLHSQLNQAVKDLNRFTSPEAKDDSYWNAFFQAQACFVFMWGIQERLELFRFGVTDDTRVPGSDSRKVRSLGDRRKQLADDPIFILALEQAGIDRSLEVRGYRSPTGRVRRSSESPIATWFEIRNNIAHHAKGSERDVEKLISGALDNFNTLLIYLTLISPRLAKEWGHLTTIEKSM